MRDFYGEALRQLKNSLSHRQWESFVRECEHRDPAVLTWAASTRKKLFQVVVRILVKAKYLDCYGPWGLRRRCFTPKVVPTCSALVTPKRSPEWKAEHEQVLRRAPESTSAALGIARRAG